MERFYASKIFEEIEAESASPSEADKLLACKLKELVEDDDVCISDLAMEIYDSHPYQVKNYFISMGYNFTLISIRTSETIFMFAMGCGYVSLFEEALKIALRHMDFLTSKVENSFFTYTACMVQYASFTRNKTVEDILSYLIEICGVMKRYGLFNKEKIHKIDSCFRITKSVNTHQNCVLNCMCDVSCVKWADIDFDCPEEVSKEEQLQQEYKDVYIDKFNAIISSPMIKSALKK